MNSPAQRDAQAQQTARNLNPPSSAPDSPAREAVARPLRCSAPPQTPDPADQRARRAPGARGGSSRSRPDTTTRFNGAWTQDWGGRAAVAAQSLPAPAQGGPAAASAPAGAALSVGHHRQICGRGAGQLRGPEPARCRW